MTEFKEKIYIELIDKIYQNISCASYGPAGIIAVEPQALKRAIRDALLNELCDTIIIDRNKFKEKLKAVKTNKTIGGECFLYRRYNIGLNMCQYVPEDTVCEANIDRIVDNIKEDFIAKLEECDF